MKALQWKIHVVDDPRYREHRAPARHPERPERLLAVGEALAEFAPQICPVEARGATDEEILRVHGRDHQLEGGYSFGRSSGPMGHHTTGTKIYVEASFRRTSEEAKTAKKEAA